jgi:abhydrolase domain-containing protein 6
MEVKYVGRKGGKGVWCYAEKGRSRTSHHHHKDRHHQQPHDSHSHSHAHGNKKAHPTLVFLHGFGADKDTWPSMIRHIPSNYHCVIIDLPGHGETSFVDDLDQFTMDSYAKSLREFLEVTGLDREPIHLIG